MTRERSAGQVYRDVKMLASTRLIPVRAERALRAITCTDGHVCAFDLYDGKSYKSFRCVAAER